MISRGVVWRASPWVVMAIAMGLFLAYAFPGYMSFDSAMQLDEARWGSFSDWHPPMMAELWRWCDRIIAGPALMLLLQAGMFVVGIYLIAATRMSRLRAGIVAAALLLFPPIAAVLAVIWKDSQMLGFFALGLALLLRRSRYAQVAAVVLLAIGTAMRHNAFTITPALVIPLFRWWPDGSRRRRYALAAAVWVGLTGTAELANHAMTSRPAYLWHGSVALFDITGMIRFSHASDAELHALVGAALPPDMDHITSHAEAAYDPASGMWGVITSKFIPQPQTPEERAAISDAWRHLLVAYPRAYLRHRLAAYREVLHLSLRRDQEVYVGWDGYSPYQHVSGWIQRDLQRAVLAIQHTPLWWPWVYLLVTLVASVVALRHRDWLAVGLGASAVLSESALYFITPTPDFRYSIWLVVCALLMPALLLLYRREREPALPS